MTILFYIYFLYRMSGLKKKSKVFKYAKWQSKWLTNESLVWDLVGKNKKKFMLDFNRFYFLQSGRDCCLGFSISHVTFSEVTSVWGVCAVAILDCWLNVYACGRQKALTMPTYCIAANCNNSQATQSITMHEFPRNRPFVRRKWVKFVQFKWADFDAAPQSCPFV